jgi:hypothetical protein
MDNEHGSGAEVTDGSGSASGINRVDATPEPVPTQVSSPGMTSDGSAGTLGGIAGIGQNMTSPIRQFGMENMFPQSSTPNVQQGPGTQGEQENMASKRKMEEMAQN